MALGQQLMECVFHAVEFLSVDRFAVWLGSILIREEAVQRARARAVIHRLLKRNGVSLAEQELCALLVDANLVCEIRRGVLHSNRLKALHGLAQVPCLLHRAAREPNRATGVVDGAENNPPTMLEHNHFRAAKNYSLTGHLILPEPIVISKTTWNKLTPEQQEIVKKYAKEAQMEERKLWDEKTASSEAKLKEEGVTFIEVDKKHFYDATAPVREKYGAPYAELIKRIEAVQ